jgi:hypothetical protein
VPGARHGHPVRRLISVALASEGDRHADADHRQAAGAPDKRESARRPREPGAHEAAKLSRLPDPVPDIYSGGSSQAAGPVAAKYADVYLTWGEPLAAVDEKLRWMEGWRQRKTAPSVSASACTSSHGTPLRRHGARRTG